MFNLEKNNHAKQEKQPFDLELEMRDLQKANSLKNRVKENISLLQGILRTGQDKELFEKFQTVSNGFLALEKVLNRINQKMS